jgi:hypothetical protein
MLSMFCGMALATSTTRGYVANVAAVRDLVAETGPSQSSSRHGRNRSAAALTEIAAIVWPAAQYDYSLLRAIRRAKRSDIEVELARSRVSRLVFAGGTIAAAGRI